MQNPFADLIPGQQPAAPRPGIIPGTRPAPQRAPQTPAEITVDQYQAQAAPAQARSAEANARRAELEAAEAEARAQDPAGTASVDQRRMAGFHLRAVRANDAFGNLNLGAPDFAGATIREAAPSLGNYITTDARRQGNAAEEEFVAATLRYESGAAIPPDELAAQRRRYFPQPNDDPATIRFKAELRRNAIDALRVGAGQAADAGGTQAGDTQARALPQWTDSADLEENPAFGGFDPVTGEIIVNVTGGARPPEPPADQGPPPGFLERNVGRPLALGVGDIVQGVGNIPGLVTNPINAGVNALFGTDIGTDLGLAARDMIGAPRPRTSAEMFASAANQGGAGGLTLAGGARAAAPLATNALAGALERFGAMPLTDTFTGATGGTSAEAARQAGLPWWAQIGAGIAGGAAGLPVAGRVARIGATAPDNALLTAGREEGVDVNRAMLDPAAEARVTAVDRTVAGRPITAREMARVGSQIEGRVTALGRGGEAMEPGVAGQAIERAATRSIQRSGAQARRQYDAAEAASEGVRVAPRESMQIIDEMIARLSETGNTNSAELAYLNGLRADLSNNLSVGALRDLRTTLRSRISQGGLVFGQNEARVLEVMDAAGRDIETGLREAGRENAARLFRVADDNYRQRMDFIQNVVQRLVGRRDANLPPGRIFENFRAMATPRGDQAGMARMIREMEPEEQADIAATFAEALGRDANGNFTSTQFIRQLQRLPQAARVNLFGERGAQSLRNLDRIAREHKRVTGAMGGSPTGIANDWRGILSNMFLGGGAGLLTESGMTAAGVTVGGLLVKAGRDAMTARMLMSRDVQTWVRNAPRTTNPAAIDRHFDRLRAIAAREPALAADIARFQQALAQAANDNVGQVGRSVAGDNEENRENQRRQ